MALNLDDLIGSMQHGFHAGDRGNDLNEIRENLKVTLGQQALGPAYPDAGQGGSGRRPANARQQWDGRSFAPPHSSLDGDVAMLSGSAENGASRSQNGWQGLMQQQQQHGGAGGSSFGRSPMSMSNDQGNFDARFLNAQNSPPVSFGGPGSYGSQGSSTSSFGFGGFAQAPANTPQQTPVESSALARQLQAELERARGQQGSSSITEAEDERVESDWSAQYGQQRSSLSPPPSGNSPSRYSHQTGLSGADGDRSSLTPRKLVNGFQPTNGGGFSQSPPFAQQHQQQQQDGGQSIGAGQ